MPLPRVVVPLGIAQTLAWGSTYYLPAILANGMAADTGTSTGAVFAAFSGALLLSAFLSPVSGRVIDLHGGRGVLATANLIFAASLVLMAHATDAVSLTIAWLVMGVGMSCGLYESAFSTLAGIFGKDHHTAPISSDQAGIPTAPGTAGTVPTFPGGATAKASPPEKAKEEATTEEPKKKRGFWSRVFGAGKDKEKEKKSDERKKPGGDSPR